MKNTSLQIYNKLQPQLDEALIGYLLGDGGIFYRSPRSRNARFEFSMGGDRQEFASHMADLLQNYSSNGVKEVKVRALREGKLINSLRFKTKSHRVFTYYRDLFYKTDKGKTVKIVPSNIQELLTAKGLAYLIMSDGNYDHGRNRVRIYTNSFSKEEVQLLASVLQTKFGIYAGVLRDKEDSYILTIGAEQLPALRRLTKDHMLSSMLYRLGI